MEFITNDDIKLIIQSIETFSTYRTPTVDVSEIIRKFNNCEISTERYETDGIVEYVDNKKYPILSNEESFFITLAINHLLKEVEGLSRELC
jgi:hypothetical protein